MPPKKDQGKAKKPDPAKTVQDKVNPNSIGHLD
jgi:hypothetical protein